MFLSTRRVHPLRQVFDSDDDETDRRGPGHSADFWPASDRRGRTSDSGTVVASSSDDEASCSRAMSVSTQYTTPKGGCRDDESLSHRMRNILCRDSYGYRAERAEPNPGITTPTKVTTMVYTDMTGTMITIFLLP